MEIKQSDNIKENYLCSFNKCVPILVILWEFKHLTQQIDQGAILVSVVLIILYVTKWFTARAGSNFWNCYLALLSKYCNTEEVTNIGNQGRLGVLSMFLSNYRINGRHITEGRRMNFLNMFITF